MTRLTKPDLAAISLLNEGLDYRPIKNRQASYDNLINTRIWNTETDSNNTEGSWEFLTEWVIQEIERYEPKNINSRFQEVIIFWCKRVPLDPVEKLISEKVYSG